MRRYFTAVIALLALSPGTAAAQDIETRDITLRGCVVPGVGEDTFVLTQTREVTREERSAIPATAHGRHVIFWLDDADDFEEHVGRMVEVNGEIESVEESEIELKAGRHEDGGLIVEFEGPGDDVEVDARALGGPVGTTGGTQTEIKTLLIKVEVDEIDRVDGTCVQPVTR